MWTRISIFCSIIGGIAAALAWAETSQWLPRWLSILSNLPSGLLSFIVSLSILALLCLGVLRLRKLETNWDRLKDEQNKTFQTWLRSITTDKQQRASNEYDKLRRDIETLAGANNAALDRFHAAYDGRLSKVEQARRLTEADVLELARENVMTPLLDRINSLGDLVTNSQKHLLLTDPDGQKWYYEDLLTSTEEAKRLVMTKRADVWRAFQEEVSNRMPPPIPHNFIAEGEGILSRAQTVTGDDGFHFVLSETMTWENTVSGWLASVGPTVLNHFKAEIPVSRGTNSRDSLVIRVDRRLERLRSIVTALGR